MTSKGTQSDVISFSVGGRVKDMRRSCHRMVSSSSQVVHKSMFNITYVHTSFPCSIQNCRLDIITIACVYVNMCVFPNYNCVDVVALLSVLHMYTCATILQIAQPYLCTTLHLEFSDWNFYYFFHCLYVTMKIFKKIPLEFTRR